MEPRRFHADAVAHGFSKPAKDYGLYLFDSFKAFDGRTYVAINNWPGKQNALALVHDDYATFEVLGHYNEPQSAKLSESAVNRLPDGTWMAICRNDGGNYHFTTSREGREWTVGREMPFVPNGANSKPTFDRFGDVYYLGWQEATRIDGVRRSVFNIDVSRDGKSWQRKYRFVTKKSFQYPTFHEHDGNVWLCVTQGVFSPSRKERIMFGKLEKTGNLSTTSDESRDKVSALPRTLGIPTVDISGERERHVVINAGTEALYQGHANTLLLPDGKTMFCVWTLNHGWGEPFLKRSGDAGKTWVEVPIPANWNDSWCKHTSHPGSTLGGTSRGWLPTIHHLVGPDGKGRLFIWDRGKDNRMNQSVSEDDGKTWSPMRENGLTGCIEPSMNVIAYGDGRKHLMWFTDWTPSVHQAVSRDGGLTWEQRSSVIDTSEVPGVKMIEPGVVRSPDGQQLLMLIRDFAKGGKYNSLYAISNDEGATWSKPKRLPASLTGDRHCPVYAPGGRLVVLMRDKLPSKQSPTAGHFIAWVGRYEDILAGRPGQYRIKLLHSHAGRDCAYPSVHLLQDGDFIATTYIKYEAGPRHQSTISARFNLPELDRRIEASDDSILAPLGYHLMDPSGDSASDASCQEQHCSNDVRRSLRIANLQGPHGRLLTVATGH
jgi:hypothetical protein